METIHRPLVRRIASPRMGAAAAGLFAGLALVSFAAAHPGLIDIHPEAAVEASDRAAKDSGETGGRAWWARTRIEAGRAFAAAEASAERRRTAGAAASEVPTAIGDEARPEALVEVLAETTAPAEIAAHAAAFGTPSVRFAGPEALAARPGGIPAMARLSRLRGSGEAALDGNPGPANLPAPSPADNGLAQPSALAEQIAAAVPEPATWAVLILGLGLVGGQLRRRPGASLAD